MNHRISLWCSDAQLNASNQPRNFHCQFVLGTDSQVAHPHSCSTMNQLHRNLNLLSRWSDSLRLVALAQAQAHNAARVTNSAQ